jgi:hypothetical protein
MLHIEWNWLLIMFIGYFFAGLTIGVFSERDSTKAYILSLEDEIAELYSQQDSLYEVIHDLSNETPAKPIRQARG